MRRDPKDKNPANGPLWAKTPNPVTMTHCSWCGLAFKVVADGAFLMCDLCDTPAETRKVDGEVGGVAT